MYVAKPGPPWVARGVWGVGQAWQFLFLPTQFAFASSAGEREFGVDMLSCGVGGAC